MEMALVLRMFSSVSRTEASVARFAEERREDTVDSRVVVGYRLTMSIDDHTLRRRKNNYLELCCKLQVAHSTWSCLL